MSTDVIGKYKENARSGLRKGYTMIEHVTKKNIVYTKLVKTDKALRLIHGEVRYDLAGKLWVHHTTKKYSEVF